jgi:hypothetical protein
MALAPTGGGQHSHCSWPSHPRNASCPGQPWPRRDHAACHPGPSISRREPCRPGLRLSASVWRRRGSREITPTKADAGVLVAHVLALLIGEEHVGRETSLWGVGVWRTGSAQFATAQDHHPPRSQEGRDKPFFFFSARALTARLGAFSLGMMAVGEGSGRVQWTVSEWRTREGEAQRVDPRILRKSGCDVVLYVGARHCFCWRE